MPNDINKLQSESDFKISNQNSSQITYKQHFYHKYVDLGGCVCVCVEGAPFYFIS